MDDVGLEGGERPEQVLNSDIMSPYTSCLLTPYADPLFTHPSFYMVMPKKEGVILQIESHLRVAGLLCCCHKSLFTLRG